MSTTWIASVAIFGSLVLPSGGYYFNGSGLLACDPFFARASFRILACCCFYFPTTMVLMYCYGSAFHVNKLRLKRVVCVNTPEVVASGNIETLMAHERRLSTSASRTMAAMSLGFIVMVTPWTIQEVVVACTGSKPPPFLDFLATWLALSNSFWNPFLYWLLNNHFRRISRELLYTKILCKRLPLGTKQSCCATSTGGLDVCSIGGFDLSGMDHCSMDRCSMARCSTPSLVTPPLPWELSVQNGIYCMAALPTTSTSTATTRQQLIIHDNNYYDYDYYHHYHRYEGQLELIIPSNNNNNNNNNQRRGYSWFESLPDLICDVDSV
ncbi:hypothetical protein PV328_007519 [Microctonus aethiopoides]|uniref:G-protein coupled receptors family 1 profile domain-containing protein n=1 Tax=Microctonus aethiopoides TaxID=144406 RepID=A0AA39C8W5_9HYME|nr:hypothetical protein PV328_007519 [Microctonus aethiopoides]